MRLSLVEMWHVLRKLQFAARNSHEKSSFPLPTKPPECTTVIGRRSGVLDTLPKICRFCQQKGNAGKDILCKLEIFCVKLLLEASHHFTSFTQLRNGSKRSTFYPVGLGPLFSIVTALMQHVETNAGIETLEAFDRSSQRLPPLGCATLSENQS